MTEKSNEVISEVVYSDDFIKVIRTDYAFGPFNRRHYCLIHTDTADVEVKSGFGAIGITGRSSAE